MTEQAKIDDKVQKPAAHFGQPHEVVVDILFVETPESQSAGYARAGRAAAIRSIGRGHGRRRALQAA